jgi:uncharacterized membrane protein
MSNKQSQYNQAIDNLTYLVLHYPKPVQEMLATSNVFFQGKPSKEQLINEVVELLQVGDSAFAKALEQLIQRFSSQENDMFWGIVAKGAVGLLGGLLKKKKRSSGPTNNGAAQIAAQAAAAKQDMQARLQRMREDQERKRREDEERRRQEERRRREEADTKKAEEAKKKTNRMLMIGGGVVVLGIGAVVLMKSGSSQIPYRQPPIAMPR